MIGVKYIYGHRERDAGQNFTYEGIPRSHHAKDHIMK